MPKAVQKQGNKLQKRVNVARPLNTIEAPKQLSAPKNVPSTIVRNTSQMKTIGSGKAVDTALPNKAKEIAKKAGGTLLKRAGAVGLAASVAGALHETYKKHADKTPPKQGKANVDSEGKSTKISMEKKARVPSKKPQAPKTAPTKLSATRIAFNKAFREARKAGKSEFTFRGKPYNTRLK